MKKYCPDINVPLKENKINLSTNIEDYTNVQNQILKFDICIKGCMVFAGINEEKLFCSCGLSRFTPCSNRKCKKPNSNIPIVCNHLKTRTPIKSLLYKSIISIIYGLIQYKLFHTLINSEPFDEKYYFNNNFNHGDVRSGSVYKKHWNLMVNNFNKYIAKEENAEKSFKMVNILLGQFYDGAQVSKSKATPFYPLFITVLNLPPNYRMQLGVGMFAITVYSAATNSVAENFLFTLFVAELNYLKNGFEIAIGDDIYFVQVRLIMHIYDTKAVESHLKVQSSNSKEGCCFCNDGGKGIYINDLNKTVYINVRDYLPYDHILRFFGQATICCPKDSVAVVSQESENHKYKLIENKLDKTQPRKFSLHDNFHSKRKYNFATESCCNDSDIAEKIYNAVKYNSYTYYHENSFYKYQNFEKYLYYQYTNQRPQIIYERKENKLYIENGKQAEIERKTVCGVKGVWKEARLDYSSILHVTWGPMHYLKNFVDRMLDVWVKDDMFDGKIRNYNQNLDLHPYCHVIASRNNNEIPWKLTPKIQEKVI
jgi:hypothetical protein